MYVYNILYIIYNPVCRHNAAGSSQGLRDFKLRSNSDMYKFLIQGQIPKTRKCRKHRASTTLYYFPEQNAWTLFAAHYFYSFVSLPTLLLNYKYFTR
jgi:hypothetical protein